MKIEEVHNCESDYHCQQAEAEDVTDIVPGYGPHELVQYSPGWDRYADQPTQVLLRAASKRRM